VKSNIYDQLNACAERYRAKSSPAEKRELLRDYLYHLRVLAIIAEPDFPGSHADFGPLQELQEYLHQIDNGECPELLTPRKANGAPTTTREKQYIWARSSALITVLMEKFNKTEEEAARLTVRKLKELGAPVPGRTDPVKSLKGWRDKLMAGSKGEQAREWYDSALISPRSLMWNGVTEPAAIQILLNPTFLDFHLNFTYVPAAKTSRY
jgi:hypothetical protein